MQIVEIQKRENIHNMTWEFLISVLGLKFRRILSQENIIFNKYPTWYRFSKWLFEATCFHNWTFDKWSRFNLMSHYKKEYVCNRCLKVKQSWTI